MPRYEPKPILADSQKELVRVVEEELRAVAAATVDDFIELTPLGREPEKRFPGLVVYADGVGWDPGAGEGMYVYRGDLGDWSKAG